jgi:hypothetical protein
MTVTSPTHALAYAHICDMLRESAAQRRLQRAPRHLVRSAASRALRWLQHGQLGGIHPCTDC